MTTMRRIDVTRYGGPDVLRAVDVPVPEPGAGEIRVRVEAASLNAGDHHLMRGTPFVVRLMFGLRRPKDGRLGSDVAGTVEAVGAGVDDLAVGDRVVGDLSNAGFGSFAERAVGPAEAFARIPEGLDVEAAATLPVAAVTALQALRDHGGIAADAGEGPSGDETAADDDDRGRGGARSAPSVLVNGASGFVGTCAVQLARVFGCTVTGTARTSKLDLVERAGASCVIDFTQDDPTAGEGGYDVVIDAGCRRSPFDWRRTLKEGGRYVLVGGDFRRLLEVMLTGRLRAGKGRTMTTMLCTPDQGDLALVVRLAAEGRLSIPVDRRFTLDEMPDAMRRYEAGEARGKLVVVP